MIDSVRSCLEISPGVPDCAAFYESIMQYLRKNEEWELEVPVDDPVVGVWDSVNVYIRHIRETTREKGVGRKTLAWSEFGCTAYYSSRVSAPLNIFDRQERELRPLLLTAVRLVNHARKHRLCTCSPPCRIPPGKRGLRFCKECGLASHESIRERHIPPGILTEFAPKVVKATPMVKPGPPSFNLYDRGNINRCLAKRAKPWMLEEAWKSCRCSSCLEDLTVRYECPHGGELFSKREKEKLKPRIFIAEPGRNVSGLCSSDFSHQERDKLVKENPMLRHGIFLNERHTEDSEVVRRLSRELVNLITGTGETYVMRSKKTGTGETYVMDSGKIRCFWKRIRTFWPSNRPESWGGRQLDPRCPCEKCKVRGGRDRNKIEESSKPEPARRKRRR